MEESLSNESAYVLAQLRETEALLKSSVDFTWLILTTIGIVSMQAGFAFLEAGVVQKKNIKSVLMKNMSDTMMCSLAWWILGFGLYSGDSDFVGGEPWAFLLSSRFRDVPGVDYSALSIDFIRQLAFALTAVTLISGGVLSRIHFEWYVLYGVFFSSFVYAIGAHWAWKGFLMSQVGFYDFAGGAVVHMVGGLAALVGCKFVGPRYGRFGEDGVTVRYLPKASDMHHTHGALLLYVGWFSFNAGSSGTLSSPESHAEATNAMLVTCLGSAAGGATSLLLNYLLKVQYDVPVVVTGFLLGLVSVTAGAGTLDTFGAVIIASSASALAFKLPDILLLWFSVDDPVNAVVVHGFGGFYGTVMLGLLDSKAGLFYAGSIDLFFAQLIGVAVLAAWTLITTTLFLGLLTRLVDIRVSDADQLVGLDIAFHAGYNHPDSDAISKQEAQMQKQERERQIQQRETREKTLFTPRIKVVREMHIHNI